MSEMVPMYGFGGGGSSGKMVTVHVTPTTDVSVTCTNGKNTFTGTTDANGDAIFKLAKGAWTITAEKSGASVTQNVTVAEDCTVNIDLNQIPAFTYTGTYKIVDDNDNDITSTIGNWKIRFLTSGTLKFTNLRGAANGIDVFLVGGGGNGGSYAQNSDYAYGSASGGGGGYTKTQKAFSVTTTSTYSITIGGSGGNTSAFGYTANAGKNGANKAAGGNGGSGGGGGNQFNQNGAAGGSNGGNGAAGPDRSGGTGQGSTTREFGESTGTLYAGGGGSGAGGGEPGSSPGAGGAGGGGRGSYYSNGSIAATSGSTNTGGGGGGGGRWGGCGSGGSGIVIIRNKR